MAGFALCQRSLGRCVGFPEGSPDVNSNSQKKRPAQDSGLTVLKHKWFSSVSTGYVYSNHDIRFKKEVNHQQKEFILGGVEYNGFNFKAEEGYFFNSGGLLLGASLSLGFSKIGTASNTPGNSIDTHRYSVLLNWIWEVRGEKWYFSTINGLGLLSMSAEAKALPGDVAIIPIPKLADKFIGGNYFQMRVDFDGGYALTNNLYFIAGLSFLFEQKMAKEQLPVPNTGKVVDVVLDGVTVTPGLGLKLRY